MDAKIDLLKNFAELEACLVSIEENKQASKDIRRLCRVGYSLLDEIYSQLELK
jgi:hypothetical protein